MVLKRANHSSRPMPEIIDLHAHMWGYKGRNFASPEQIDHFRNYPGGAIAYFGDSDFSLDGQRDFEAEYVDKLVGSIIESGNVSRTVLLAMDEPARGLQVHHYVSNMHVIGTVERHKNSLLFGASVNPALDGAVEELAYVYANGAVLNKILQNSMRIDLSDRAYDRFFGIMNDIGMPLLVHSGNETAVLGSGDIELGNPKKLEWIAKKGVKIIISHCGSPEYFNEFLEMAQEHDNVYGGLAAMGRAKRYIHLLELAERRDIHHKLVFETDYPLRCDPTLFSGVLAKGKISELEGINFFDQYIGLLKALGFDSGIH